MHPRLDLQYPCRVLQGLFRGLGHGFARGHCSKSDQPRRGTTQGFPWGADGHAVARAGARPGRALAALILAVGSLAAGAAPADACGRDAAWALDWRPLGRDTWWLPAARGEPDAANRGRTVQLVLLRERTRLWLVGGGATPGDGAALACGIRALTGRRVTDLVVTRAAPELAMGSVAFAGARRWALAAVRQRMHERCGGCIARLREQLGPAGQALHPDILRLPDHVLALAHGAQARLGPFDALALRRAEGEPVLVLRHRRAGLVIAQGLLWAGDLPDLHGSRGEDLDDAWRRLLDMGAGVAIWLGEQGGPADAGAVQAHRAYLQALDAAIGAALARGEAWGEHPLPGLPPVDAAAARRHDLNLQHRWQELESAWLR